MKSTGRLITAVIIIIFIHGTVIAADIRSDLTRNRIKSGDYTTLKVKISGTTADIRPVKVPAVKGLDIKLSGTSRNIEIINDRTWIGFILNFTIHAKKKGVYRIPPFIIEADGERLATGEYVLTVTEGQKEAELINEMAGEVELTAEEVYAGEPLLMRYFIKGAGDDIRIERLNEPVQSKGFVIKALKEEGNEQGEMDADNRMYIASYCLVAADSGKHKIGGGAISVLYEVPRGFLSRVLRREVRFPGKTVNIRPLPAAGRPAFFKGDVGEFSLEAGEPTGSFRAGEEVRIPVKVRGRGNLIMMSPVSVEKGEGIKLLVEDRDPKLSVDNRT
ncbi:MAG TPA: BatD family protein, partial [Spirochaetota bacterium]|nr:BatD family protein [Spirochaetota bacterium]HPJ35399.1 BatD family protein [Spirochaetota bacterium]